MGVKKNRFLIYVLVAMVAGFIFVCWLYLLPYILKNNKKFEEQKNNFQKVNEDAIDTLEEVKEIIKDMGNKIQELKQTTSTQTAKIANPGMD